MNFTLKQLRYFDAALRCGSIVKAAKEMSISQSSITAAIDMIEHTTGVPLFRRIPAKGIVATEAGKDVGVLVAKFLERARVFDSDLRSLGGDPTGTLRLACYAPTAPYVLPLLLKRIAKNYPAIRIDLKEGDMESIDELLQNGGVDVALTYRMSTRADQPFVPLFNARPWALIPDASPLAGQKSVRLAQLADLPMILLDLPTSRAYFEQIFMSVGLRPNVVHRTKSSSVLRGLVAANFGYSILNICGHGDRAVSTGYVACPIIDDIEEPIFGIAYSAASMRSAMVQAILEIGADLAKLDKFDSLLLRPDLA